MTANWPNRTLFVADNIHILRGMNSESVGHILPRSKGGTDHPDNLQLLCSGCNRSKGGWTMAEWRAAQ